MSITTRRGSPVPPVDVRRPGGPRRRSRRPATGCMQLGISPRADLPAVLLTEPGGKIRIVGLRLSRRGDRAGSPPAAACRPRACCVYSSAWCPDCRRAKRVLEEAEAAFEEVDIDRDAQAEAMVLRAQRRPAGGADPAVRRPRVGVQPRSAAAAPAAARETAHAGCRHPRRSLMKIAVCIKQVPNTEARLRVSRDGRWLDEEDLPFVINESDEYALEEGLALAEKTGGEVVVFSLGPERVKEALRKALAVGAARAVHFKDPAFLGGDALATGRALAAAVSRERFDLVLTGSQSDDVRLRRHRLGARRPPRLAPRLAGDGRRAGGGGQDRQGDPRDGERHERDLARAAAGRAGDPGRHQPPALRLAQGDHGGQEEGDRQRPPGRPGARRRARWAPRARGWRSSRSPSPRAAPGAQMLEGDAKAAAAALVDKLRKEARVL